MEPALIISGSVAPLTLRLTVEAGLQTEEIMAPGGRWHLPLDVVARARPEVTNTVFGG